MRNDETQRKDSFNSNELEEDKSNGTIKLTETTKTEKYIEHMRSTENKILPRPFLENLEEIAKKIHENYNKEQLKNNPNKPLLYPEWNLLPDDLKYSNVRQARGYFDKLMIMGLTALPQGKPENEVMEFNEVQIEELASQEHDSWYEERKGNGWSYGPEKDDEKRISPYIKPYEELTEEIKELDRNAVRNIFPLLHSVGLKIYHSQ